MLKYGEVNPLNVLGLRRLEHCPPHFKKVVISLRVEEKRITDWVYENLSGRFWSGDVAQEVDGRTHKFFCLAFEKPSESSFFALHLDKINITNYI
jgi:hypothetical protein